MSTLHYYKNPPKPSQTKVRIIYPSSGTLELWKFSNLTFKGFLACTTPVLCTRSSLFLFHRCCLEHMRTMWLTKDFWHHQLALSMGKVTCKPDYHFLDKELHRTYSLDGNHQQQSGRTTYDRPWEIGSDSHRGRRMPHQAKPWPKGAAAPKELWS